MVVFATLKDDVLREARATQRVKLRQGAAELPFEQATEVSLNINLKTAKALGLVIPEALIARADAVIE